MNATNYMRRISTIFWRYCLCNRLYCQVPLFGEMSSDKRLPYVVDKVDEPTFIIEPGNFKKYLINCLKLPLLQVPDEIMGYVQKYEGDLIEYCKVSSGL